MDDAAAGPDASPGEDGAEESGADRQDEGDPRRRGGRGRARGRSRQVLADSCEKKNTRGVMIWLFVRVDEFSDIQMI